LTVLILRTDGREEAHEVQRADVFRVIERLIDAAALDTVNLRDGRVMFVDDFGYETELVDHGPDPARGYNSVVERKCVKARKPINAAATALYHGVCLPGTTHRIVGDVAIARDADFADEGDE
jgi:hypothetical protein